MKKFLIFLLMVSLLTPADKKQVGRYQLEITTAKSKSGTVYVIETVFDTKEGKIVKRKKIQLSKYKYPQDKYGRYPKKK
tara:strand:+ start:264 stop:500 length:237 start_codon:yes stop_codon:yes gene_type:complete